MPDNLDRVFQKFFKERTENLFDRFDGLYRAVVEETNDPLRIGRVRVRIPELHNKDVKRDELPWAAPAFPVGGKGSGLWYTPIIGDIIWVQFEKNHPYAPVWVGSADPTRRKFYPLQSIHGKTPLAVNGEGQPADTPDDFEEDYLPKDERPMTWGMRDRYGSFFMMSSVGFFPKEHEEPPAPVGTDAVARSEFKASRQQPKENEPDVKYAVLHTKYGHTMILSDVGYQWKKEFKGDFAEDENFEIARHKYLVKFFNEGEPKDRDQRRMELRTRYGHKLEMRDVGWKSNRPGEFENQTDIGKDDRDERWVKLRTKGGHIIQSIDKGNDAKQDKFVKQLLKTDKGSDLDGESEEDFKEDARQIRLITRHGAKFALDDRGSDKVDADKKEDPHGNGVLVKTRRNFGIDMNDKDPANRMLIYSPKSKVIDINDRFDYVMMSTDTAKPIPEDFAGTKNNEFSRTIALTHDPERTSFHLKLDKKNKYVSLKTPEGQGIEMRDGDAPCASFTETRGPDDRGLWMSRNHDRAVWRDKRDQMYIALDDAKQLILVRNDIGKIQIYANVDVEIIAKKNISLKADQKISMQAGQEICMEAAGTQWVVQQGHVGTNAEIRGRRLNVVSMYGTHEVIQIPCHPCGPAPAGAATGCSPVVPQPIDVTPRKPKPFDQERNCAPNKPQARPLPKTVFSGGSGGFGMPPSDPPSPPPPSPNAPPQDPDVTVKPPQQPVDPLSPSGGVLFYGTSTKFETEISLVGLRLNSFANNNNIPPKTDANRITLFMNSIAAAEAALIAQERYGDRAITYRVLGVVDPSLLVYKPELNVAEYFGSIPADAFEVLDIGPNLGLTPQFPDV